MTRVINGLFMIWNGVLPQFTGNQAVPFINVK